MSPEMMDELRKLARPGGDLVPVPVAASPVWRPPGCPMIPGLSLVLEHGVKPGRAFELYAWLDADAADYLPRRCAAFWLELDLGPSRSWVRFALVSRLLKSQVFAADEWLPARSSTPVPEGFWLCPSVDLRRRRGSPS